MGQGPGTGSALIASLFPMLWDPWSRVRHGDVISVIPRIAGSWFPAKSVGSGWEIKLVNGAVGSRCALPEQTETCSKLGPATPVARTPCAFDFEFPSEKFKLRCTVAASRRPDSIGIQKRKRMEPASFSNEITIAAARTERNFIAEIGILPETTGRRRPPSPWTNQSR